ncbi:MAG: DUF6364 family protein [Vicinamibacterales bacterium]
MEKLTLSVDGAVVERAKRYAAAKGTSVSRLVETFLDAVTREAPEAPPPVLARLRGVLKGVKPPDYRRYLERKYR